MCRISRLLPSEPWPPSYTLTETPSRFFLLCESWNYTQAHTQTVTHSSSHSEHRFPAPSSKLCQILLHHWRGTLYLRSAVHWHGQYPPKGSGTNMTWSNLAPKHAHKHEAHPPWVEKEFCLSSNECGFICAGVNFVVGYKWHALFYLSCL